MGIEINAPKASASKYWLADDHLTQTLAGKVPHIPVKSSCVEAAAFNRVDNGDLNVTGESEESRR